jgi:hypothetical protein
METRAAEQVARIDATVFEFVNQIVLDNLPVRLEGL